ncbi:MAG: DUF1549 domain-containing protein, partial [Planctomycetaceae bacterium]|nr:DUF1549 domain-containing protein [Planctomycetaceae bacterium]
MYTSHALAALVSVTIGSVLCLSPPEAWSADHVDFATQVQPLLADHCLACHGVDAETREGGLRLDARDAALQGGDSGTPAVVPGRPLDSELWRRITATDPDTAMPPADHNNPLTQTQKDILQQWILEGAEYSEHWAFVPPVQQDLPGEAGLHPIDAFVRQRLRESGLELSPQAEASVLCRRLYLDLVGLPPSPKELMAFQQDGLEVTVERLLASERFGEKWARHWLDVARYSDTNG